MKDKYKHLLNFTANIISLAVEACMFGWVWYMLYIPMLDKANTFFNRGNWAVIGMYVLFVFFFTKIFGRQRLSAATAIASDDGNRDYIYRSVGRTGAKGIYASVSAASDACDLWKLFAG